MSRRKSIRRVLPRQTIAYLSTLLFLVSFFHLSLPNVFWHWQSIGLDQQSETLGVERPVWWHAPFLSGNGYGFEAVDDVLALRRLNLVAQGKLWLTQHWVKERVDVLVGMDADTRIELLDMLALGLSASPHNIHQAIVVCHSIAGSWGVPRLEVANRTTFSKVPCPPEGVEYVIGRTMWESDLVPSDDVDRCNRMHEIWVPSKFNREVYIKSGVTCPVFVIPISIDTATFDPARHTKLHLPIGTKVLGDDTKSNRHPFVFLSIFSWQQRKGWDILLQAFLEEFAESAEVQQPSVALYVLIEGSLAHIAKQMQSWAAEYVRRLASIGTAFPTPEGWPAVYVITGHLPTQDLPRLYKAADAFVLPSRGEGWGMPVMEAMSMELPVIATNWSGITDYLDDSVGYPISVEKLVPGTEAPFTDEGQKWAQPSVSHLRLLMRRVVEYPQEAVALGRAARARVQMQYSPAVVAHLMAARFKAIDDLLKDIAQRDDDSACNGECE